MTDINDLQRAIDRLAADLHRQRAENANLRSQLGALSQRQPANLCRMLGVNE
jgi:hypothetical protein